MPLTTPYVKIQQTRLYGAEVVLHGESLDSACEHAGMLAKDRGRIFVHPFDDCDVIAGQGTVALEMLAAQPSIDTLVVPIGGGGLAAGMALAAKSRKPDVTVIGVQTTSYPSMVAALAGESSVCNSATIAEGMPSRSRAVSPVVIETGSRHRARG